VLFKVQTTSVGWNPKSAGRCCLAWRQRRRPLPLSYTLGARRKMAPKASSHSCFLGV